MKYIQNEQGNSAFYLLWIIGMTAVVFIIVMNIGRVYIVKQQAATATQQAAIAGTSVLIEATNEGVDAFDQMIIPEVKVECIFDKPVKESVNERVQQLRDSGKTSDLIYITAFNDELIPKMNQCDSLKGKILESVSSSTDQYVTAARNTLESNEANSERLEVLLSDTKWRVEVKADATFETITDGSYLKSFKTEIPQKGYGPPMEYLKVVYGY